MTRLLEVNIHLLNVINVVGSGLAREMREKGVCGGRGEWCEEGGVREIREEDYVRSVLYDAESMCVLF